MDNKKDKSILRKQPGVGVPIVVAILMLVALAITLLTWGLSLSVSNQAEHTQDQAYEILTGEQISRPSGPIAGPGQGGGLGGNPGGSGGSGGSSEGSGGSEEPGGDTPVNPSERIFTITYNANGFAFEDSTVTNSVVYSVDDEFNATLKFGVVKEPVSDNYEFGGWYTDAACTNAFVAGAKLTADITVYAKMNPLPAITYAIYSNSDKSLTFYSRGKVPDIGSTYNGKAVTKVYQDFANKTYSASAKTPWSEKATEIKKVDFADTVVVKKPAYWFYGLKNAEEINLQRMDVSTATDISGLFKEFGSNVSKVEFRNLASLNTAAVKYMDETFHSVMSIADAAELNLSGLEMDNVISAKSMFSYFGQKSPKVRLNNLNKMNISSLSDANSMFAFLGAYSDDVELDMRGWDTQSLTNAEAMFRYTGQSATQGSIYGIEDFDVTKLKNASSMFNYLFGSMENFTMDLSNWEPESLENTSYMFEYYAYRSKVWGIGDISDWDMSKVTTIDGMFKSTGDFTDGFELDLSGWDLSSVKTTYSNGMFNLSVKLSKITIGPKWKWGGAAIFNTPSSMHITGADGHWHDFDRGVKYSAENLESGNILPAEGEITVYEAVSRDYTITYDANGGHFSNNATTSNVTYSKCYNKYGVSEPIHPDETLGFAGWYLTPECLEGEEFDNNKICVNMTVYAKYAPLKTVAIYTEASNRLAFYKTAKEITVGGTFENYKVDKAYYNIEEATYTDEPEWIKDGLASNIKTITVVNEIAPAKIANWFSGMINANNIDLKLLNISKVTDATEAFELTSSAASNVTFKQPTWNTSSLVLATGMFRESKLPYVDISTWNMTNVENTDYMFYEVYMDKITIPGSLRVVGTNFASQTAKTPTLNEIEFLPSEHASTKTYSSVAFDELKENASEIIEESGGDEYGYGYTYTYYKVSDVLPDAEEILSGNYPIVFLDYFAEFGEDEYEEYYSREYMSGDINLSFNEEGELVELSIDYLTIAYKEVSYTTENGELLTFSPGVYFVTDEYWHEDSGERVYDSLGYNVFTTIEGYDWLTVYTEPTVQINEHAFLVGAPYNSGNLMATTIIAEEDAHSVQDYNWYGDNRGALVAITFDAREEGQYADGSKQNVVKYVQMPNDRQPGESFTITFDDVKKESDFYYSGALARYTYATFDNNPDVYLRFSGETLIDWVFDNGKLLYYGDLIEDLNNRNVDESNIITSLSDKDVSPISITAVLLTDGDWKYTAPALYYSTYQPEYRSEYVFFEEYDFFDMAKYITTTGYDGYTEENYVDLLYQFNHATTTYNIEYPGASKLKIELKSINEYGYTSDNRITIKNINGKVIGTFNCDDIGDVIYVDGDCAQLTISTIMTHGDFEIEVSECVPSVKLMPVAGEYAEPLVDATEGALFKNFEFANGNLFTNEYDGLSTTVYATYGYIPIIKTYPGLYSEGAEGFDYQEYSDGGIYRVIIADKIEDYIEKFNDGRYNNAFESCIVDSWDISAYNNGSVMAYLINYGLFYDFIQYDELGYYARNANYELVIAGNGYGEIQTLENFDFIFADLKYLTAIEGLELFNTKNAKTMNGLFYGCPYLREIPINTWDTSNVTSMNNAFVGTEALTYLDLSDLNLSSLTSTQGMLAQAGMVHLALPSTLKTINSDFAPYCENLATIEFKHEASDELIIEPNAFTTSGSEEDYLTEIITVHAAPQNYNWESDGRSIEILKEILPDYPMLRSWAVSGRVDFHIAEYYGPVGIHSSVTEIEFLTSGSMPDYVDIGPWDVSATKDGSVIAWGMLTNRSSSHVPPINSSVLRTPYEYNTNGTYGFGDYGNKIKIYIMANGAEKIYANPNSAGLFNHPFLTKIVGLENLDTSLVVCGDMMFYNTKLEISGTDEWKMTRLKSAVEMFYDNPTNQIPGIENWDMRKLENADHMFTYSGLSEFNLNVISATAVESGEYMFRGCEELVSLTIPASVEYLPTDFAAYANNLIDITFEHSADDEISFASSSVFYTSGDSSGSPLRTYLTADNEYVLSYNWLSNFNREIVPKHTITYNANGGIFAQTQKVENSVDCVTVPVPITKHISKTDNITDSGEQSSSGYGDNVNRIDAVSVPGAQQLQVTITYATESTSYDWVAVYDGSVTPTANNYAQSISGKLGNKTKKTQTYIVDGDKVQFFFRSDGSVSSYYGYYAEVVPVFTVKQTAVEIIKGECLIPVHEELKFGGWYTDPECTEGNEFDLNVNIKSLESDIVVYAKWEPVSAFAIYSETDNSLRFYKRKDYVEVGTVAEGKGYNGLDVTAIYTDIETTQYYIDEENEEYVLPDWVEDSTSPLIKTVVFEDVITPISTCAWFANINNYEIIDLTNLDTSQTTNMSYMFDSAGQEGPKPVPISLLYANNDDDETNNNRQSTYAESYVQNQGVVGLNILDTSSVVNMEGMFQDAWNQADIVSLDLSGWDVSSVTNMAYMFDNIGEDSDTVEINLSNWDVSSVTDMSYMFAYAGDSTDTWIMDLSTWDVSSVTDISYMFMFAGENADEWHLDVSNWDTSSVVYMDGVFEGVGYSASLFSLTGLEDWDTSSVIYMCGMFRDAGYCAEEFVLTGFENWDTSSVVDMSSMFSSAGFSATVWKIGDISGWDTSNVTDMSFMFGGIGYYAIDFEMPKVENWDVSSVTTMQYMFNGAASYGQEFKLDLSNWRPSSLVDASSMFIGAGYSAPVFEVNVSDWDTSSLTYISFMFEDAGRESSTFEIIGAETWDTSNVTHIAYMFSFAGYNATYLLDLSSWDVGSVLSPSGFDAGVESKIISPWDI